MGSTGSALKLENVLYEKKGPIVYVTINRPKVLNALSKATLVDLNEAFEEAREDSEVRGVILTSAGDKAFKEVFTAFIRKAPAGFNKNQAREKGRIVAFGTAINQEEKVIMAKQPGVGSTVYKVVEVVGTSTHSWEGAAKNAVETAGHTLRDLRVAEVVKTDLTVKDGQGAGVPRA